MNPMSVVPKAMAVVAVATILVGCPGSDPVVPAAPPESEGPKPQILLHDNVPQPGYYTSQFGEPVVWKNAGSNDHSVSTYGTPDEWEDTLLKPGETFSHAFSAPGEYAYVCVVHGEVGSVIVTDEVYDLSGDDY